MTAVEYLLDQMFNHGGLKKEQGVMYISPELVAEIKEMEKQQMIDAHCDGQSIEDTCGVQDGERYYNETFKTK